VCHVQVFTCSLSFGYASYLVHTGKYGFGKWSKDAKNGFHWGIAFASIGVLSGLALSVIVP
jgi:hypothetical protein